MIPKNLAQYFQARGLKAREIRSRKEFAKIHRTFAQGDISGCRDLNRKHGHFDLTEFETFLDYYGRAAAPGAPRHIVLLPNNLDGRLVNYHHFFSGFLAPLIEILELGAIPDDAVVLYPDVAVLNRHITDVLKHYDIVGHPFPNRLGPVIAKTGGFEEILVPGYDETRWIGTQMDRRQIELLRQFRDKFAGAPIPNTGPPRVVFVDRASPPDYYQSTAFKQQFHAAKGMMSGASRRAIANANEVKTLLADQFSATTVYPEKMSLRETAEVFRDADVIVAQHGAGLDNLYWCDPPCFLIEIVPINKLGNDSRYFRNICSYVGLDHCIIAQRGPFAPVNLNQLLAFTKHAVTTISGR